MRKTIRLHQYKINCQYLGVDTGGFSDKLTSAKIANKNMTKLRRIYDSTASTLMLPSDNSDVIKVKAQDKTLKAAAFVTDNFDHSLLLRPADCIPLIIFGEKVPLLALVHCGRKELDSNIVERTLLFIKNEYSISANQLKAYLGPAIKKTSYILPKDIEDGLLHSGWKIFIKNAKQGVSLDLFGFTRFELERCGLRASTIKTSSINTASNKKYYSHYSSTRKGESAGLNGFAVVMKP